MTDTKEVLFEYTFEGKEGHLVYVVPHDTEISEDDAEYDAMNAAMKFGTYPPTFREF